MKWRYRNTVLAVAVYGFFTVQASRFVISPLVPAIIDSFTVTKGTIGLALTGMWAAYALLQYPSGVLGDRFGERRIVLIALALTGIGSAAVAFAPTFGVLATFTIVLGAGAGLYFPAAASLVTGLFEKQGQALGFIITGSSLAGMLAPAVAAYLSVSYGWRVAIPLGGVLVLPGIVLFAWRVRSKPPNERSQSLREGLSPAMLIGVLSRPSVAFTMFISIIGAFTFQALISFLPTFLIEYRTLSTQNAGVAFGALFLLSAAAQTGMGRVSDIRSRDTAISISMVTTATGLGVLLLAAGDVATVIGVVLIGLGLSWGGVIHARFTDSFGDEKRGTGLGLVRMVFILLGSSGNAITGALADTAGWVAAYGVVIGLLGSVIAAICLNRLLRTGL